MSAAEGELAGLVAGLDRRRSQGRRHSFPVPQLDGERELEAGEWLRQDCATSSLTATTDAAAMHNDDAFLLLSLPSATLERQRERPVTDSLYLECVTAPDREMYLVIKLGYVQVAVDPHRRVIRSIKRDSHFYSFLSTDSDSQFSLSIPLSQDPVASQDLETFNHILTQYLTGFSQERVPPLLPHLNSVDGLEYEDLRGHLVLVNESDGSVLGDLDHQFKISEDSALFRNLPEDAPVLIELPPDYDSATSVRTKVPGQEFVPFAARQAFVRAVPPEERDALTNTATLIR